MESGSRNLIALEAQRRGPGDLNTIGRRASNRGGSSWRSAQEAGLGKGSGVSDPEWIMNAAGALDFDAELRVLAGNHNVVAAWT